MTTPPRPSHHRILGPDNLQKDRVAADAPSTLEKGTVLSRSAVAALAVIVMLAACGEAEPTTTSAAPETTTTAAPTALTSQEVFSTVSPALAFVEVDLGSGSGVLFDESHLVTNAHVVWPHDEARVVFPNGTEIEAAPVTHFDEIADLAIIDLGGVVGLPPPVVFGDPGGMAVGTELFLIGYPGEVEKYPQPTLTRGILSRVRTIEALGLEYLQTDAVIAGGQSGGALVTNNGEVIGISGLGSEGFGLATAADDVLERLGDMLAGDDVDGIPRRTYPADPADLTFNETVQHFSDERTWIVDLEEGDEIVVEATSDGDVALALIAADAYVEAEADEGETGSEALTFEALFDGPYFLTLGSFDTRPIEVAIESNLPMRRLVDPDDGAVVTAGDTVSGYADYPGDIDYYLIDLAAGDTIDVLVSAVLMDPMIIIDLPDNPLESLAQDVDSGGGLFGTDARLTFTAETDDTYLLVIVDEFYGPGGYVLKIDG